MADDGVHNIRGLNSGGNDFLNGRLKGCVVVFDEVVGVCCGQVRTLAGTTGRSCLISSHVFLNFTSP